MTTFCPLSECTWNPVVAPTERDERAHVRGHTWPEIRAELHRRAERIAELLGTNAQKDAEITRLLALADQYAAVLGHTIPETTGAPA